MTLQMCEDPQTKKMTCIESSAHKDNLLLDAQDLRTYFFTTQGIIKAVDGVSFHIKRGETLSLVGESGCGKTCTCLSVIRLIPEPQGRIVGGSIFFKGENLLEKSKREMKQIRGREISMIFQDPMSSLNPVFTIGNQVAEAIRVHQPLKGRRLIERVIEVLKLVHIPSPQLRRHDYPHQMSGGMRQRVSGAIALSPEPSLIIADEPTTSLDVTTQAQYLELLENIQKKLGVSILFVTHNFGIVAKISNRVAVMYAGRIVESGGVREIFTEPAHPYTRALLKSIPDVDSKVDRLASIKGEPPSLYNLPEGCYFSPRCTEPKDICFREYPRTMQVGPGHFVNCWQVR